MQVFFFQKSNRFNPGCTESSHAFPDSSEMYAASSQDTDIDSQVSSTYDYHLIITSKFILWVGKQNILRAPRAMSIKHFLWVFVAENHTRSLPTMMLYVSRTCKSYTEILTPYPYPHTHTIPVVGMGTSQKWCTYQLTCAVCFVR